MTARKINLTLLSDKDQTVNLRFPVGLSVPPDCRKMTLTKGKPVHLEIAIIETETSK